MTDHNRVTYSREMRERAKRGAKGLITVEVVYPDGNRMTLQGPADASQREAVASFFLALWQQMGTPPEDT